VIRLAEQYRDEMRRRNLISQENPFMQEWEEPPRYASWRHASGRGRKDILTFGDLASSGATAVVELYRPGSEPGHEPEEVTASVPELRLSRPVLPSTIETKFGAITVEPFRDRAPNGERRCVRFARASRNRASRSRAGTATPGWSWSTAACSPARSIG